MLIGAALAVGLGIVAAPALLAATEARLMTLRSSSSSGESGARSAAQSNQAAVRSAVDAGLPSATNSPVVAGTTSGSVLARFAPLYMGGQGAYTSAQAIAVAQQFSVIAEHSGVLTPYLAAMKAANPALKIVAYMNGTFDQSAAGTTYPSTWYARDLKGNRIQSQGFGNWLMTPTSAWGTQVATNCKNLIAKSKYDGCFLDTMGLGPLLPGYVTGLPVNPATKAVYTAVAWINAQSANVKMVQAANPGTLVVPNGLASGPKYFSTTGPTAPLLATSHIAMSEIWLRVAKNPVTSYPSLKAWKQDIDMLASAESNGWAVMVTTKLWISATAAQQAAWHRFSLASFLLGAAGRCAFSFSVASTDPALTATSPWDTVAIGTPVGAYTTSGSAYVRTFSHGFAVVNPGTTTVTVSFGKAYVNLDGKVMTSEALAPHTGDVLVG